MCAALLSGGTIVCIDYITTLSSTTLEAAFLRERVNTAVLPPALLKQCLANAPAMLSALDTLLVAGDRFDSRDALQARALVQSAVYNAYGPTENGIQSARCIPSRTMRYL